MSKYSYLRNQSGFTMVEIIIVLLVFGVLATVGISQIPDYLVRRRDAQRKADLRNMKLAFEEYAADKSCYPPTNLVSSCQSTNLNPYLRKVPCDPKDRTAYRYVLSSDCRSYELYTILENTEDGDIAEVGCNSGCGPSNSYNYGVVGGGALLDR